MKSLAAILFLVLVFAVLIFAALRLLRLIFGRAPSKQKFDDASDVVDAAKIGIGMLAVSQLVLSGRRPAPCRVAS